MKKFVLIIGILLVCHTGHFAQMMQNKPLDKTVSVGIKGGMNMPRMLYFKNPDLTKLPQSFYVTPTGGLFVEVPMTEFLYLSPEVDYVQRGTKMNYVHKPSGAEVNYSISTHNLDLRLPLEFCWEVRPYFRPFVTVGVEAGMCMSGKIKLDRTAPIAFNDSLSVDSANMNLVHAGAFAGAGVRSRINLGAMEVMLKLSATFHQGFVDSYSPYEKNGTAQAQNVNAYQISGMRWPQGLEICLGIAIPLKPILKDACASFSNDRSRHGNRGHLYGY